MLRSSIYDHLRRVRVIDTHEHLWDEAWRLEHPGDWTALFRHYAGSSLEVAGLSDAESETLFSPETEHERKWSLFARVFPLAKNTAYVKAVLIAIRDLYGIETITSDSMRELTERIRQAVRPGFYRQVLQERAGIEYCLVNCFDCDEQGHRHPARTWGDTDLMRPALWVDAFIYPKGRPLLERETGRECDTLSGWLQGIDSYFEKHARRCPIIKVGLAYYGSLDFQPGVPAQDADALFARHVAQPKRYADARPLVDFLFFQVLQRAADYGLPLQFHTGIYSGTGSLGFEAQEGNVRHLAKLALAHPECRFAAMHIAYPYHDELAMAIKNVRNLYAEMSWAWVVDPHAAAGFLKSALCAAPVTKVFGFGGDYSLVESTYGHLEIARRGMASALADLVECGHFDEAEACEAGTYLLRGSAERFLAERV